MTPRTDTPRAVVLAMAAALGGVLLPGLTIVAMPIVAMALAHLWASGRRPFVVAAIAVASAVVGLADLPAGALVAVVMVAAGPAAASMLRRRSPLAVGSVLSVVVFAAVVVSQATAARLAGTTLPAEISRTAAETLRLVGGSLGEGSVDLQQVQRLLIETWPATNMQVAAAAALLAVATAAIGAQAGGVTVRRFPRLATVDLGVHVLWLPVLAVAGLAVGRLSGTSWLEVAALNALLVSRIPLALQGLGVFGATYDRMGLRRGGRIIGYSMATFVELTTYAVSLVGLVDFWANFRRLPRDGSPEAPLSLEEPGSSG